MFKSSMIQTTSIYSSLLNKEKKIAVLGLGYIGLPLALEFAKHFSVIGFDINQNKVNLIKKGIDPTNELDSYTFVDKDISFTTDQNELSKAHFYVIAVPTDLDGQKLPDLRPLLSASKIIGQVIKKGDFVIYESTVYPGCTEEDCLPVIDEFSGLKAGEDYKFGYSPERINPGDKNRPLASILKIVSGSDKDSLDEISKIYGHIITAGIYEAPSVKVAEAAKVIENTQRDLNISLMNELSMIFDKMGIDTKAVIEAAGTKWNFVKFYPGLVGGHCIGVDPYYLLHKARELGYEPQVIAAGRRVNDEMPKWIAKKLVQQLVHKGKNLNHCKVLVMGVTFKENVADIRNSKVIDLVRELMNFAITVHISDPYALPNEVAHEYKLNLVETPSTDYDAIVVTVGHDDYKKFDKTYFDSISKDDLILVDLKGLYPEIKELANYTSL
jgi:UDP-N-acetyl-D-glucosamine/UDP-N-acetyl-D-galactosamine dehydrogenase